MRYSSHVLKVVLAWGICVQPPMKVLGDEGIIGKITMFAADAVDLGRLVRAQPFVGIEAPDSYQQPLTTQDFVANGRSTAGLTP